MTVEEMREKAMKQLGGLAELIRGERSGRLWSPEEEERVAAALRELGVEGGDINLLASWRLRAVLQTGSANPDDWPTCRVRDGWLDGYGRKVDGNGAL